MAVRDYKGAAPRTALAAPMTSVDLTFTVASGGGTGYPDGSGGRFTVCLDAGLAGEEKVDCVSRAGDVFTVAAGGRGYDDTAATTHGNSANVDHVGSATDLREANVHVNATGAVHGLTGSIVGTTDTQTLTNKTLTTPTVGSFTNAQHNHSNAAGGGKLAQANTHESPDTDSATSALHHTLGTGANQAAAGNHSHAGSSGVLGAATVATAESTSSASFTDLATVGPSITVTVPASGKLLLTVACRANTGSAINHWEMSADIGGAAASAVNALAFLARASEGDYALSRQSLVTGLTPSASITLTAKYLSQGSGPTTFSDRTISAIGV